MDKSFAEEMRKRVEKELQDKELATVQYWKEEAEKIVKKPSESLSALQVDLKSLISRMETRLRTLKKSGY
ncbi:MAG: hypothetical protein NTY29_05880 [Proteobacteria bacterium]|jgi:hypothetical protein|nr:hypothetical protein [Pseudomonadota bacterium]